MYQNIDEKLQFTDRFKKVEAGVRSRLRPRNPRESTLIDPIPTNGKNPFADVFEEMPDAPYVIALAHAIVRSWLDMPCVIYPHEAVVGITRPTYPIMEHFSWGIQFQENEINAVHGFTSEDAVKAEKARIDALRERMTPLPFSHVNNAGIKLLGKEHFEEIEKLRMYWAGGFQGHTLPNYVTLLTNGLDGMLAIIDKYAAINVKNQETADFYEANRILARGMIAHLEKYAVYAKELAEKEEDLIQKRYYNALDYVERMQLPVLLTNIAQRALVDGCYYGLRVEGDKNNFQLIDLPSGYACSRFKDIYGNDVVEFDLSYFATITDKEQRDAALAAYPKIV